jgi:hypothetical protein
MHGIIENTMSLLTSKSSSKTELQWTHGIVNENQVTGDPKIVSENCVTADSEIVSENWITIDQEIAIEN